MSTENNKINRQQKFVFKLLQIIDLKSLNEYVVYVSHLEKYKTEV